MWTGLSPRTTRRRRRKQTIIDRSADLPHALLVEDSRILTLRTLQNFPDDSYFDEVPSPGNSGQRIEPELIGNIEQMYQKNTATDNADNAIQLEEVVVNYDSGAVMVLDNSIETDSPPPVMTGGAYNGFGDPVNPVSLKIATIASRHSLKNDAVDDILAFTREVSMFYRDCIPRNTVSVDEDFCIQNMDVEFLWKCACCGSMKNEKLFNTPFRSTCCDTPIALSAPHYVLFNAREILKWFLPMVFEHINVSKLESLCPTLRKIRQTLEFTNDDVSLTLNVDGVSLAHGSKSVIWPILGYLDGTSSRCADKHILMFGFWLGKEGGKPDFDILLGPLIEIFRELKQVGISWKRSDGSVCISRAMVSTCLCDSVARPLVQGMMQWNSEYGCPYCLHKEPGHYFTPCVHSTGLRTGAEYRSICEHVESSRIVQRFGIRRPTPFLALDYFDPILGFPPCIMHAGYLGVAKALTETLLESVQTDVFYVSTSMIHEIDNYLSSIKPPYRVSRCPRSLKLIAWYKAHELCMWLMYYSPVILSSVLPSQYFQHWLSLVRGLSLVLCEAPRPQNLKEAAENLLSFGRLTFELYGRKKCHFNVHLMTHLPHLVEQLGPLYLFSMAPFETFNMKIKSYITSSHNIAHQITKRYIRDAKVKLSLHESKIADVDETLPDFSLHARRKRNTEWYKCPRDNCDVLFFGKIIERNGRKYYSKSHTKTKSRNSYCFRINQEQVLEVAYYAKVACTGEILAVGALYTVEKAFNLWHYMVSRHESCLSYSVALLQDVVLKICWRNTVYFAQFINSVECYNE